MSHEVRGFLGPPSLEVLRDIPLTTQNYIWNANTLAWEKATGSLSAGANVGITNFPDVISGPTVPMSNQYDDVTARYKVTDLDSTDATKYFGYTDADGNWYIMQLTDTTSRYFKGVNNYTANWVNRANLQYDYFYNIF